MSDLVLLFNQVQLGNDARILLEPIFSHGEQLLYDVLDTPLNFTLMQNVSESLKYSIHSSRRCL